ncbi:site-specific integrase [Candidatus Thioglobus sp.]|nr:site-specific integrase [Candidatus Thioglobus sp.]
MATIQKILNTNNSSYRVFIRKQGLKTLSKTFPTKKLAKEFALSMESDIAAMMSIRGRSSNTLFKHLVDEYLLKEYTGSRPKAQAKILEFWTDIIGERVIMDITKNDIYVALELLPSNFSNATINRYKAAISVVFSYACRTFDLPTNPVRKIPSLPENNERIRFLSEAERTRLFGSCRASQWDKLYLLVLLAITTGARKGELTKLGWGDIDFDRRTAYVATTKNGQPKVLPLTDSVIKELQLFDTKDNSLIFASKVKEEVAYCFTKPWKKALKDADIKDFRFHDLRHSCASYLAQSGASLLEIADVLGHKQISVTKRYAHLCIEHKSSLINRVMGSI